MENQWKHIGRIGGICNGKKRIEIRLEIGWHVLIYKIFWRVKFEQCEVKFEKIRVMHETWIQTMRDDARMMRMDYMNEWNLKIHSARKIIWLISLEIFRVSWITGFKIWWELEKVWERKVYVIRKFMIYESVTKSNVVWQKINVIAVVAKEGKQIQNGLSNFEAVIYSIY